jgi:hypothetical protein
LIRVPKAPVYTFFQWPAKVDGLQSSAGRKGSVER